MKNDAICGKNPRGIFTINVLILNPHGSNGLTEKHHLYSMNIFGLNRGTRQI
jgi:hypothetical protein